MPVSGPTRWIRPTLAVALATALTTFASGAAAGPRVVGTTGSPAPPAMRADVPPVRAWGR